MGIIHFVISGVNARIGGMERSATRIAEALTAAGARVIFYTFEDDQPGLDAQGFGFEIINIKPRADRILAPVKGDSAHQRMQASRIVLEQEIANGRNRARDAAHVVLSFYVTTAGFIAQQAAQGLGLPHIASVRGTDFSRDFYSPAGLTIFGYVIKGAKAVVTLNGRHEKLLRETYGGVANIVTIPNAVEGIWQEQKWNREQVREHRIFSDIGFSFKKATHLLFDAFRLAKIDRAPLKLAVIGNTAGREAEFWRERCEALAGEFPGEVDFRAWATKPEILELMRASAMYSTSSLDEGDGNGIAQALCLGIPVVASDVAPLVDMPAARHLIKCRPGDAASLASGFVRMSTAMDRPDFAVDDELVEDFRRRRSPAAEQSAWLSVIDSVLNPR